MGTSPVGHGHNHRRPSTFACLNDKPATAQGFIVGMRREDQADARCDLIEIGKWQLTHLPENFTCGFHGVSGMARCMKCAAALARASSGAGWRR